MPQSLPTIPLTVPITERDGTINIFFRQMWQLLQNAFRLVPTVAVLSAAGPLTVALPLTVLYTTESSGTYRVGVALTKTLVDGVSSALTVTIGWTSRGLALTHTFAPFTTDAPGATDFTPWQFYADANSNITVQIAYASNTPGAMVWRYDMSAEQLA